MLHAKGTPWSSAETDRLRHLASVGITPADAARRMARNPKTVRRMITAAGIDWRQPAGTSMRRTGGLRIDPLDGIRGLALIAVLAYHVAPTTLRGGFLGVDVFFVLSGFLLTSLLVQEHARTGQIGGMRYAGRRLRRIVPALGALLVALIVVVPIVAPDDTYRLRADVLWSAVGLTNWHLVADGTSYFAHLGRQPYVRHLWSIAIEVQFYVVCPFLVAWLVRRHRVVAIGALAVGIALSAAAMGLLYVSPDPSRAYFGTETRVGALLVGVLLAVLTADGGARRLQAWMGRWPAPMTLIPLIVLAALVVGADERSRALYPAGFMVTQAATALIILLALRPGRLASALAWSPLRWLGRRSYGIYLWSWPIVVLSRPGLDRSWYPVVAPFASIAAAVVLGALSYRFIEEPWLRPDTWRPLLQLRRSPMLRLATAGVGAAVVAGLVVSAPSRGPVADSLVAGQRALYSQQTSNRPLPVLDDSGGPAPSAALTPGGPSSVADAGPTPAPTDAASQPVTAIGDSVMLGAAAALTAKFGQTSYIDAQQNRQFSAGAGIAQALAQQGRLGHVVIMDLGNNGPIQGADVDGFMRNIPPGVRVLFVTVRVDQSWERTVNEVLAGSAARYRSVKLVDWYTYSANHPDWFWDDGTHLRPEGADAYANMIAGAIS